MPEPARRPVIDLYGVATDAGASARGTCMGPEALRIAGLIETLTQLGHEVTDHGDFRRPSLGAARRQAEVLTLAAETSTRGQESLDAGRVPIRDTAQGRRSEAPR